MSCYYSNLSSCYEYGTQEELWKTLRVFHSGRPRSHSDTPSNHEPCFGTIPMKSCFRWGELLPVCPFVRFCVQNRVLCQGYHEPAGHHRGSFHVPARSGRRPATPPLREQRPPLRRALLLEHNAVLEIVRARESAILQKYGFVSTCA